MNTIYLNTRNVLFWSYRKLKIVIFDSDVKAVFPVFFFILYRMDSNCYQILERSTQQTCGVLFATIRKSGAKPETSPRERVLGVWSAADGVDVTGGQLLFSSPQLNSEIQKLYQTYLPSELDLTLSQPANTRTRCEICSELTVKVPKRLEVRES